MISTLWGTGRGLALLGQSWPTAPLSRLAATHCSALLRVSPLIPRPSPWVFSTSLRHLHGSRARLTRPDQGCRSLLHCPQLTRATGLSQWLYFINFASCFCFFFPFYFKFRPKNCGVIPSPSPSTLPETLQLKTEPEFRDLSGEWCVLGVRAPG